MIEIHGSQYKKDNSKNDHEIDLNLTIDLNKMEDLLAMVGKKKTLDWFSRLILEKVRNEFEYIPEVKKLIERLI